MKCPFEKTDITSPIFWAWTRLESLAHRHIFGRISLSSSGFKILVFMAQKQSVTPSEILSHLEMTKSNLSQRLRVLEEKLLIKRSPSGKNDDKRIVRFSITAAGKKKLHEASLVAKQVGFSFEKNFTKEEIKHHIAFFSKLITVLDQKERELETFSTKNPLKK